MASQVKKPPCCWCLCLPFKIAALPKDEPNVTDKTIRISQSTLHTAVGNIPPSKTQTTVKRGASHRNVASTDVIGADDFVRWLANDAETERYFNERKKKEEPK